MKVTCIMCPVGCQLEVKKQGDDYIVFGNSCVRGERYGKQEVTSPTRMVTTVAKTNTGYVSVKTSSPVPKSMVQDVVNEIGKIVLHNPKHGDVAIKNVLGLNIDVIVTSGN